MVKPSFGFVLYALLFWRLLSIPFYQNITTTTPPFYLQPQQRIVKKNEETPPKSESGDDCSNGSNRDNAGNAKVTESEQNSKDSQ